MPAGGVRTKNSADVPGTNNDDATGLQWILSKAGGVQSRVQLWRRINDPGEVAFA